jgi:hypothetical protein
MVFGIFKMLGYRFAPRFRDLADQRFWRADLASLPADPDEKAGEEAGAEPQDGEAVKAEGYGPLEAIARNKVNLKKIETWWPDMPRTLSTGRRVGAVRTGACCTGVWDFGEGARRENSNVGVGAVHHLRVLGERRRHVSGRQRPAPSIAVEADAISEAAHR